MAPARTILGSLRTDDVTIPFWLRAAGAVVGAVVAVLVVVSAAAGGPGSSTAGPADSKPGPADSKPADSKPAAGPAAAGPAAAGPAPSGSPGANLPALPAPLASGGFHDPGAVAASFAATYQTWVSPDGPPGSAARVEPYATADLFAHFPEPTWWPAPSALAAIDKVTVAASSPRTSVVSVALTQHLLGQDGRPIGPPQTSTMSMTVEQESDGGWLVGSFTMG
ncbi:MAG: hypothetical protein M3Y91_08200 [Actinomycetota bacterium]|nr:hypothetical protein [Actinomycetota bacterium]